MAGVCEGECMGCSPGTSTRCHSCGLPQPYEVIGWKSVCGRACNLKGVKGKISFLIFNSLSFVSLFCSSLLDLMRADHAVLGGGGNL